MKLFVKTKTLFEDFNPVLHDLFFEKKAYDRRGFVQGLGSHEVYGFLIECSDPGECYAWKCAGAVEDFPKLFYVNDL